MAIRLPAPDLAVGIWQTPSFQAQQIYHIGLIFGYLHEDLMSLGKTIKP
jgi:hypothetical protein